MLPPRSSADCSSGVQSDGSSHTTEGRGSDDVRVCKATAGARAPGATAASATTATAMAAAIPGQLAATSSRLLTAH